MESCCCFAETESWVIVPRVSASSNVFCAFSMVRVVSAMLRSSVRISTRLDRMLVSKSCSLEA
ncbi:MAG: hypothetical protein LKE39_06445 [Sphaerochaeta sp.]|nr:hypothetical protein [Sphaerochaeta sp.]